MSVNPIELIDLLRRLSRCNAYIDITHVLRNAADSIESAHRELDEARRDSARLDWLGDVNNYIGNVQLPKEVVERNVHSLRDAIDDAMKGPNP